LTPQGAMSPAQVRATIRSGAFDGPTSGLCPGYVQANLVVLPIRLASDFERFCALNPRPMPLLEVLEAGKPEPRVMAAGADLRTDLPRYAVYRSGSLVDMPTDVTRLWREDLVAFLLGCSFTAEARLARAGVRLRHLEAGRNVAMFKTSLRCVPTGHFQGPLVVSMRPVRRDQLDLVASVTGALALAHGAPLHVGDPAAIGIRDLGRPDWGDAVEVRGDEEPVFWACGVTPQAAILETRPEIAITHAPGHMFITDWRDDALEARGRAARPERLMPRRAAHS
jgi:uncharacterized protein YcsI (UPF0317 family)